MKNGLWILLAGLIFSGSVANVAAVPTTTDSAKTDSLNRRVRQDSVRLAEMNSNLQRLQDSLTTIRRQVRADSSRPDSAIARAMQAANLALRQLREVESQIMILQLGDRSTTNLEALSRQADSLRADINRRLALIASISNNVAVIRQLSGKELADIQPFSVVNQTARLAGENERQHQELNDLNRQLSTQAEEIRLAARQQEIDREKERIRQRVFLWTGASIAGGAQNKEGSPRYPTVISGKLGMYFQLNALALGDGLDLNAEFHPGPGKTGEGLNWWAGGRVGIPLIYEPRGFQSWLLAGARATKNTEKTSVEATLGVRLKFHPWALSFELNPQNERVISMGIELYLPPLKWLVGVAKKN